MTVVMQEFPLTVGKILDHAAKYHPNRKIVSRSVEGPITEPTGRISTAKPKSCLRH